MEEKGDGELDAAALGEVRRYGQVEGGGAAGAAGLGLRLTRDRAAGGVVVVAEVLVAEGGATAAVAVCFDMAALVFDGFTVRSEGLGKHYESSKSGFRECFSALRADFGMRVYR